MRSAVLLIVTSAVAAIPASTGSASASAKEASAPSGRIAYSDRANDDWEIFIVNANGRHDHFLTRHPGDDLSPAWSRDGRKVAFYDSHRIYVVRDDGSHLRVVAREPGSSLAWSPDGRRIAFDATQHGGGIAIVNVDGSGRHRLTRRKGDSGPTWSADGRTIAFTHRRRGSSEIRAIGPNGTGERRLLAAACCPQWSPNGKRVEFIHRHGNYVMNVDGSGLPRLRAGGGTMLTWSPDSRYFAFATSGCGAGIWILRADGKLRRILPGCHDFADIISWGPDR